MGSQGAASFTMDSWQRSGGGRGGKAPENF